MLLLDLGLFCLCCCCASVRNDLSFCTPTPEGVAGIAHLEILQLPICLKCQIVSSKQPLLHAHYTHTHTSLYIRMAKAHRVHVQLPREDIGCVFLSPCCGVAMRKKILMGLQGLWTHQTSTAAVHKQQPTEPTLAWWHVQKWDSVCLKDSEVVLWRKVNGSTSHRGGGNEWATVSLSC